MDKLNDYIVFITIGTTMGNGVIVGKYLITAGHVIHDSGTCDIMSFRFKGNEFNINKNDSVVYSYCSQEDCDQDKYDVAVYNLENIIEGINSPLSLSVSNPQWGDHLLSVSCIERPIIPENRDKSNYRQEILIDTKVFEVEGNFFRCQLHTSLDEGQSGSPVIEGQTVVGILYGGINPDIYAGKECLFQTAKSILDICKQITM